MDEELLRVIELFDDEVVPASEIKRPQSALDREMFEDFNKRNPAADGGRIPFGNGGGKAFRLKQLQEDYNAFGQKELDKAAKTLGFKNYASMSGEKFSNKRKKIRKELREFGEVMTAAGSRQRSRVGRIKTEQGIQIKLLEETNKKNFFDPKKFAKANNISLLELKKQAALLQKNIYNKRMKLAGKDMKFQLDWIPNDPMASDNALNKLWKSKLIKYDKNKIDELFYQAFGNPKSNTYNPKKFLAIKKNLNEYRQLRDAINAKYPKINFELDHPLSKSSLNKLFNATTDQLTRVNVLEADLNNGFKDSLSLQYEKAVQSNNLNKKKAVEKIAKDLNLNIGKISDNATNFKYGVKEFQKLNIKDEIGKSLLNLSNLNKNFQDYAKKNPELFKTANINPNQVFTQIKPSELKQIQNMLSSPQFNAKIPILTDILEVAKSIPDDFKKAKYLKGAFKALGIGVGAPLVAYDTYKAYKQGKPVLEALEQGFIGTDMIGGTKRILSLTPEERTARSVVKQDALKDLNLDMPMGFGFIEGPTPDTDMTLKEAQTKAAAGADRVKQLEAQKNFERATNRANFFSNIKDRAFGIQPNYQLELAGGGIAKLAGIDEGPQTVSMNPDSQGLQSLKNRVKNI